MKNLLDKVHAGLADVLGSELGMLSPNLEKMCGSPIEVALGLSILLYDRICPTPWSPLILAKQGDEERHYGLDTRLLIPQYQLDDKRIDFLLREDSLRVFIECDGHDFHERTKKQAANDRRRDREIQQSGAHILRFTGSEIWSDPIECASQVFDFVSDQRMHQYLSRQSAAE